MVTCDFPKVETGGSNPLTRLQKRTPIIDDRSPFLQAGYEAIFCFRICCCIRCISRATVFKPSRQARPARKRKSGAVNCKAVPSEVLSEIRPTMVGAAASPSRWASKRASPMAESNGCSSHIGSNHILNNCIEWPRAEIQGNACDDKDRNEQGQCVDGEGQ